jgi:hypothetical protein
VCAYKDPFAGAVAAARQYLEVGQLLELFQPIIIEMIN